MLMTGSLGMVASTLPVQRLLPLMGWRGLFWLLAALLALAMTAIARVVAADARLAPAFERYGGPSTGYREVFRHPTFLRFAPLGLFHYGGMIAVQSLWAGPWLVRVCGFTPLEAARGLFAINVAISSTVVSLVAACGGPGVSGGARRARSVGLKPPHLRRGIPPAVGHRTRHRRVQRAGMERGRIVPGGDGIVGRVLRRRPCVVFAS